MNSDYYFSLFETRIANYLNGDSDETEEDIAADIELAFDEDKITGYAYDHFMGEL